MRAVEFDDQVVPEADEINRLGTDRGLTAELMAAELPGAEEMPKALFGAGGFVAECAGKVALILVAVHEMRIPLPSPPRKGEGAKQT